MTHKSLLFILFATVCSRHSLYRVFRDFEFISVWAHACVGVCVSVCVCVCVQSLSVT
jgi:hypothetical protein